MSSQSTPVTYGNIMPPGRTGLMGLPLGVTLAGVPAIVIVILMLTQLWFLQALATTAVGVTAAGLMVWGKKSERTVYERMTLRRTHAADRRAGRTLYVAGPAGKVPDGSFTLPGLMASSDLSQHTDAYGNVFGLIRLPAAKHYTVVIEAFPDGDALVDPGQVDRMVAQWGAWLAQLGVDEGVVGASVTVETATDSGVRLARMVKGNIDPSGSPFAHTVAAEVITDLSTGSPVVITRLALTFSGKGHDDSGTDRGPEAMAEDIANRLPELLATLKMTGAGGSVRACTAQDIVDFTRVAYDPTVATAVEAARTDGGTGLTWSEAGPSFTDTEFDRYHHDRAVSRTWQMWRPPQGIFYSNALRALLEPTTRVLRKRVTLLYRPVPASHAADAIEAEQKNATFTGSEKKRRTARQRQREKYAEKAAQEEALGAGLLRFGLLVTVSCASADDLPRLEKVIPGLGNRARLRLREADGNHAVAFQAALPLGVVLPEHSVLPAQFREFM